MILAFAAKGKKTIACVMLALIYLEAVVPAYALGGRRTVYRVGAGVPVVKRVEDPVFTGKSPAVPQPSKAVAAMPPKGTGGPTQPEMESFHSVNSDNMVDLFSGNFSYNIPLLDVDGYPLSLGYSSGITMDQEASWTGLGWNINPGTITRNVRGLPDDFNGSDLITKTLNIKENKTSGGTGGATSELFGFDLKGALGKIFDSTTVSLTASLGLFKNTYRGWGMEMSVNPSISVSNKGAGSLTAGLGLGMSSQQDGLSISPSLDVTLMQAASKEHDAYGGHIGSSLTFNTRSGMKALQYSAGVKRYRYYELQSKENPAVKKNGSSNVNVNTFSSYISYAYPSSIPAMNIPYTSEMYTGKFALGFEVNGYHPQAFASGYQSRQYIAEADRKLSLPAYGYLYSYNGAGNINALLDYNREREMPIKEGIKNIAIPSYTNDVFSISGEGTGGMFRAFRNDIGYVHDHFMATKDKSGSLGVEIGTGSLFHGGADLTTTQSTTVNSAWAEDNPLAKDIAFTASKKQYEAVYFKNPGEMAAVPKAYYEMLGGDDVVFPEMTGNNTANISTTESMWRYKGGKLISKLPFNNINAANQERSKRTQVISYLTAEEASMAGLSRLIENYGENQYVFNNCDTSYSGVPEEKHGYIRENFQNEWFGEENGGRRNTMIAPSIYHPKGEDDPNALTNGTGFSSVEHLTCRWTGKLKAPATGVYYFNYKVDDGVRITINGKRFTPDKDWDYDKRIPKPLEGGFNVNLEKDNTYDIVVEYYNASRDAVMILNVYYGNKSVVPNDIYQPIKVFSYTILPGKLTKEERVDSIRKPHHISEIDVLNNDGRKYVYGLPVYNLKEKEVTFSVDHKNGNVAEGTVSYNSNANDPKREDSVSNSSGNDHYFISEETPAYAHSFLLTGVVSSDYVDLTGDGITDDDAGNAVKFNYTKTAGQGNPYKWRTPYTKDATYNEGLRSENNDDKGSYVYGEKELWYLNSIESKNMVATFTLEDRHDLLPIDERGNKIRDTHQAKCLKEINLYVKADYVKNSAAAKPVKTVHFEYSYELCRGVNAPVSDSGKLTLTKVWFSYNGNESKNNRKRAQQNAYEFNYNKLNPRYSAKSYDRWGEYKPASQNPMGGDGQPMSNPEYPYAIQDSTLAAANVGAWTLDSIKLPSGGRIKVVYEGDDYAYVQNRRAAKMTNIAGFSRNAPRSSGDLSNKLYDRNLLSHPDNLYVAFNVSRKVNSKQEVMNRYLSELHDTLFFRLNVNMPSDKFGSGSEYVATYGFIDKSDFGFIEGTNIIYVKLRAVNKKGNEGGDYSPLAQAAIHFLRLNLPSKCDPGSYTEENMDMEEAIKMVKNMATKVLKQLVSFDESARKEGLAQDVDLSRSYARLNDPDYKKYGGGLRVKKLLIYDHWNKMTGKKESIYGTEYKYTTIKNINGKEEEISSGVATYEPILGGEENPFHTPNIYAEQAGHLAPIFTSYVENPLGEGFFPSPSVGYSKVTTRSINTKNTRSANGSQETRFYTAYEFPTIVESSELGDESKFRYKPKFENILKVDAKYHLAISQGFKIELNDMHGKMRSQSTFAEAGKDAIASTTYYYRVDNDSLEVKHLSNTVATINAKGEIDTAAIIGKNIELMMDMRQQTFRTHSMNRNINVDGFLVFSYLAYIPIYFGLPQNEENIFKSAAATKVITRQGILDRIEVVDKGSKVVTRNLLYDNETGEVLLTATQNEFGDSIYQFNYPAAWAYDGMSGAYKNIQTTVAGVNIRNGKIISGLSAAEQNELFVSGDEMLIYSRNRVYGDPCIGDPAGLATFPSNSKIWAVDANALNGNTPDIYFLTKEGKPFTGEDVTLKVVTSGRKNLNASMGSVTMMKTPLVKNGNNYELVIDKSRNIINASVTEYKQNWHVEDDMKSVKECVY